MLRPYDTAGVIEAGTDEAGRGCIAGPVFAAAVILPADFHDPELNDSKQLTRRSRERLRETIIKEAAAFHVASASPEEIDAVNILNASIMTMHRAIDGLGVTPEHIIVDGNRFKPYHNIPFTCFVKGDGRYASIAAASILAKTFRDDFMREAAEKYPQYGWDKNFGYPTAGHRNAVLKYGLTPLHRKSFRILPDPELFGL
ncbi:MAG TPA: ribonuclease HII [Candidatus Coprenecus stercoravium]|uniref:Ribonuclease HII n=1 Tax=Candidatus Coprenecus stercoravium TaxID=2840735 RepID=A0A9D2K8X0_9BACT|nr:ribonuclease HII [Candidatus Coprenecus stercoravium]